MQILTQETQIQFSRHCKKLYKDWEIIQPKPQRNELRFSWSDVTWRRIYIHTGFFLWLNLIFFKRKSDTLISLTCLVGSRWLLWVKLLLRWGRQFCNRCSPNVSLKNSRIRVKRKCFGTETQKGKFWFRGKCLSASSICYLFLSLKHSQATTISHPKILIDHFLCLKRNKKEDLNISSQQQLIWANVQKGFYMPLWIIWERRSYFNNFAGELSVSIIGSGAVEKMGPNSNLTVVYNLSWALDSNCAF